MIRHHSNRYCRFPFAAATLCVVIAAVASSAQQPQSKSVGSPQVVVRGLRIVAKPHGDDQQMRPFNCANDLQLLGCWIPHSSNSPAPVMLFLSRRFSRVRSATHSFRAMASDRRSFTSGDVA